MEFWLIALEHVGRAMWAFAVLIWFHLGNFVSKISFGSNFCAKAVAVIGWWAIMGDEWISLR